MELYFKITNIDECHHRYQYHDGLNVLKGKFNANPSESCCAGGFYFTTAKHIHKFYNYGVYLRVITLPKSDPNFQMVIDPQGDKWRANQIILGERYSLGDVKIYEKFGINVPSIKFALDNNFWELVEHIFKKDQYTTEQINEIFFQCIKQIDFDSVVYLFHRGIDELAMKNALRLAFDIDYRKIIKYFIKYRADMFTLDENLKNECFLKCVVNDDKEMVMYFIELGIDNDTLDNGLLKSIYFDNWNIMNYLIQNGANINSFCKIIKKDVITKLVDANNLEMVKKIIEYDMDSEIMQITFENAIHSARQNIITYLIEKGYDVNTIDNKHKNYFFSKSVCFCDVQILEYFIEKGIDNEIISAVLVNAMNYKHQIAEFLVKNGADVRYNNSRALINAIDRCRNDNVILLVSNGANIHVNNDYPLRHYVGTDNLDMVKFLVNHGANVNIFDGKRSSTMKKRIRNYLVKKGAQIFDF